MTNTLPMGFRTENGEIIVDAREQKVLEIVQRERQAGKGTTAIARTLNAAGLTNRAGKPFTPQAVQKYVRKTSHEQRQPDT